ncbi:MAG: hypothetical protein P8Z79_11655 [Sedimentisphaerales bacterium]|jgi:hypothetical protein
MRTWTRVWIAIALACGLLTIYEIPKARLIGRFLRVTLDRDRYTASGRLNTPAIVTDGLVERDPEAADMLRYCLNYASEDVNIADLATFAEKYPENEFFLAQLAENLTRTGVVDPNAALIVVDKLLKLNGDNAHYRYLRGWILLERADRPDYLQAAVKQFEMGHSLPQFYLPYSKYKKRLDRLYKRAALFWERPHFRSFYTDLARRLFLPTGLRGRVDDDMFEALTASLVRIGDRVIDNAYDSETLVAGAVLVGPGAEFRLRDLDLPEAEARQSRLHVARGVALLARHEQLIGSEFNVVFNAAWMLWLPLALFIPALAWFVGTAPEFLRRHPDRPKPEVLKHGRALVRIFIGIDAGAVLILVPLVVLELLKERPEGELPGFLLFLAALFASANALWLSHIYPVALTHLRRPRLWIAATCASLWFKGAVFWTAGDFSLSTPGEVADRLPYIGGLLAWSILCVLIWAGATYQPDALKSGDRHWVTLIAFWAVALMAFHILGLTCLPMDRMAFDPLAPYRPLPQPTQQTYDRVILGQEADATSPEPVPNADIPARIGCAAPNDLTAFLDKQRTAGAPISDERVLRLLQDCNRDLRPILLAQLTDPNAYDALIIRAGWGDRTVKKALERLYQDRLAIFRRSKPEPRPSQPSSLGNLLKLAGTLARISDGDEAQDRLSYLLEYVVEQTRNLGIGPNMTDPRHAERIMQPFWEALGKLPKGYATKLVKSYLRQTRYIDLFGDRRRDLGQLAALLAEGDTELAGEIVGALAQSLIPAGSDDRLTVQSGAEEAPDGPDTSSVYPLAMSLMRYRQKNTAPCLEAVFAHLSNESVPALLAYLDSDNDQLRAFLVWRLTTLGYEWSRDRLDKLVHDSSWEVRLNSLFALDTDGLLKALDDENAVVRLVARKLSHTRPS